METPMRILITGGAGFVGSFLARAFKREDPRTHVVVFDNLRRRGTELNLPTFKKLGVNFIHGDVRHPNDFDLLDKESFDLLIEASAEPSVSAGLNGSPHYVFHTNLNGLLNCIEFARKHVNYFLFLSTSRVYSIASLRGINLTATDTRFVIANQQDIPGVSPEGIAEDFPTHLPRSFYGATKLASEMLVQEYVYAYGLKAIINRCGVIAGPGQFGKIDQGVFTLWVAAHYFNKPLQYTGFEGTGKQVRDLLHPADLFSLIKEQLTSFEKFLGQCFNVGGGVERSISLLELTQLCQKVTNKQIPITQDTRTSPVDVPMYISNCQKAKQHFNWQPVCSVEKIVQDTLSWIQEGEEPLKNLFS